MIDLILPRISACIFFIFSSLFIYETLLAEQAEKETIILDATIESPSEPQELIFLIIEQSGKFWAEKGLVIGALKQDMPVLRRLGQASIDLPEQSNFKTRWLIAVSLKVKADSSRIYSAILARDGDGTPIFILPREVRLGKEALAAQSIEDMRELIRVRRRVLQSYEIQLKAQDSSLERLRKDAEVIADLGRILDARDRYQQLLHEINGLERDMLSLQESMHLVKTYPIPNNNKARESQLIAQTNEIAQLAKDMEREEVPRRSKNESGLQEKLKLIEATRYDDYELIQNEILSLKTKRAQIGAKLPLAEKQEQEEKQIEDYLTDG